MNKKPYIILGGNAHFTYDIETDQVQCTHGGWGGRLTINSDSTADVKVSENHIVEYDQYLFTDSPDFDTAYDNNEFTNL